MPGNVKHVRVIHLAHNGRVARVGRGVELDPEHVSVGGEELVADGRPLARERAEGGRRGTAPRVPRGIVQLWITIIKLNGIGGGLREGKTLLVSSD